MIKLLAGLLFALVGGAQAPTPSALLDLILAAPNKATVADFEALARPGDFEAMTAMKRCLAVVTRPRSIARMLPAFRHFRADQVRRMDAMITLSDLVFDRSLPQASAPLQVRDERLTRRLAEGYQVVPEAATRTLLLFGEPAVSFLDEIFTDTKIPDLQSIALAGLLPGFIESGSEDDFKLVLDHFQPDLSGSVEEGVLALRAFDPDFTTPILSKAAADKRRSDEVRAMALTAVSLAPGKKVDKLVLKQLKSDARAVQTAAVQALQLRGLTGHTRELEKLLRSNKTGSRRLQFEALKALSAELHAAGKTEDLEELLFEAADDKRFERRLAAAENLTRLHSQAANERLVKLLTDLDTGVRLAAIESVVDARVLAAIPALIGRRAKDSAAVRERAHDALERLTGLGFVTADSWQKWWQEEGAGFQLPPRSEAGAARATRLENATAGETQTPPKLFDLPIRSDRVVFVLDHSGSMNRELRGSTTYFERTRFELLRTLKTLPPGAQANVIVFSENAISWAPHMLTLNAAAYERIEKFLSTPPFDTEETRILAGLNRALDDPNAEEIILLTDGDDLRTREIYAALRARLEMRKCVVSTIAIGGYSHLLERIAEITGGEYREL